MLLLPDGCILVECGEPLPANCARCGEVFRPKEEERAFATCPNCCRLVDLDEPVWSPVVPEAVE